MKKNIHILPTDKPSSLFEIDGHLIINKEQLIQPKHYRNIYITSDEKIKVGDWILNVFSNKLGKVDKDYKNGALSMKYGDNYTEGGDIKNYSKIILTTDQNLIDDGIQTIDGKFLDWFVKNPSCEFVMTLPDVRGLRDIFQPTEKDLYEIIIPREEVKRGNNFYEELKHYFETTPREKVLEDWNKSAEFDKVGSTVEELKLMNAKLETLEEVAKNSDKSKCKHFRKEHTKIEVYDSFEEGFIEGANWHAKRSYSEEDMMKAVRFGEQYKSESSKSLFEKRGTTPTEVLKTFFEQFKKK